MAHLLAALFFGALFIGIGIAARAMVREYRQEIMAALTGGMPMRRPSPAPRLTVTLRARPRLAPVLPRRAAA